MPREPDFAKYRPEPTTDKSRESQAVMTIRMPSGLRQRLRIAAAGEGISMNSYVLAVLDAVTPVASYSDLNLTKPSSE